MVTDKIYVTFNDAINKIQTWTFMSELNYLLFIYLFIVK